jgi:hypothetical protein
LPEHFTDLKKISSDLIKRYFHLLDPIAIVSHPYEFDTSHGIGINCQVAEVQSMIIIIVFDSFENNKTVIYLNYNN